MRKLILAAALAGCAIHVVPASAQEGAAQEGAAQTRVLSPAERADPAAAAIDADQIAATVTFLADDLLQGRDGQELLDEQSDIYEVNSRAIGEAIRELHRKVAPSKSP